MAVDTMKSSNRFYAESIMKLALANHPLRAIRKYASEILELLHAPTRRIAILLDDGLIEIGSARHDAM